jgi:release factor glutamine methyltransferase
MAVKIQTIKDIRFHIKKELTEIYNDHEIKVLSDILIRTATGIKMLHQLYDDRQEITENERNKIISYVIELKTGKPIQYVTGETIFYNCLIKLNSATLIPRPETEELVDLILKENKGFAGKIIDFGSGSGCISIALASNLPTAIVTGIEISEEAIDIARSNAELNRVNVTFSKNDILNFDFTGVEKAGIIVSNPPYVRVSEKKQMSENVLDFEPPLALFVSDSEPLIYYNSILKIADQILLPGGQLYFEINEAMGQPLIALVKSYDFTGIEIAHDLNEKERILKARKYVRE